MWEEAIFLGWSKGGIKIFIRSREQSYFLDPRGGPNFFTCLWCNFLSSRMEIEDLQVCKMNSFARAKGGGKIYSHWQRRDQNIVGRQSEIDEPPPCKK